MVGKKTRGAFAPFLRIAIIKGSILLMFALLFINTVAFAQEWHESYDPNTEVAIRGKIVGIIQKHQGPVVIGVLQKDKIYNVLTAPSWYIEQEKIDLKPGDDIVVNGAKFFSKKGELFIFARSINNISKGKIYSFRENHHMKPKWRGRGKDRWNQL